MIVTKHLTDEGFDLAVRFYAEVLPRLWELERQAQREWIVTCSWSTGNHDLI